LPLTGSEICVACKVKILDTGSNNGIILHFIPAKDGIFDQHPETGIQYLSQLRNK